MAWQSMHGHWVAEDGPVRDLWLKLAIAAVCPGIPIALFLWLISK